MNEQKKSLIFIVVAFIFILSICAVGFTSGNPNSVSSEEVYTQFSESFKKQESTLVYIGRSSCGYCGLLDPNIEEMSERYGFKYLYIDTDALDSEYMSKIMSDLELESVGTPYLAVINNEGIVDTQTGYVDYDLLFEFLQNNDIISTDAELLLNYIGLEEYNNLLASSEPSVVVVGQSTCGYCIQQKLVYNQIVDEYGIDVNYLNISYLTEEEGTEFQSSVSYFEENEEWGTPITFILKDGEVVSYLDGYNQKESVVSFLEDEGVLK